MGSTPHGIAGPRVRHHGEVAPDLRSEPAVLFRAPRRPWALLVAIVLFVLVIAPMSIALVLIGVRTADPLPLAILVGAALLVLLIGALMVLSGRQSFIVTTTGIIVASYLTTRRGPWHDVQLVRVGPATLRAPRATELLLRDGSTVRPFATSMNFAIWRGETPLAHGADGTAPTRCTLAAIDAHRRFLAGEFGR